MKLISCPSCAVVLDGDALEFPEDIYDDDYGVDMSKAIYSRKRNNYVAFVLCPVCKEKIGEPS